MHPSGEADFWRIPRPLTWLSTSIKSLALLAGLPIIRRLPRPTVQPSREHAPDQQGCTLLPHPSPRRTTSKVSIQAAAAIDHRAHEQVQQLWFGNYMRTQASTPLHRTSPPLPRAEGPAPRSASSRGACDSVGAGLSLDGIHGPGDSPEPSLRRSSGEPTSQCRPGTKPRGAVVHTFETFRSGDLDASWLTYR